MGAGRGSGGERGLQNEVSPPDGPRRVLPGLPLPQLLGPHSQGADPQRGHGLLRPAAVRSGGGRQREGAGGAHPADRGGNRLWEGEHHRPLQGRAGQPGRYRPLRDGPLCGDPDHH